MKRKITLLLCILLAFGLCACAKDSSVITEPSIESAAPSAPAVGQGIPFRYLHRGFTAIQLDDRDSFEAFSTIGTKVILDEEAWNDYMGRFCPGIPYFDSCDFSKECLLASVTFGAKPTYTLASTVTRLTVEDGSFVFEYDDNSTECLALNSNDTSHFYVEVLIVSREDIPEDTAELVYAPST